MSMRILVTGGTGYIGSHTTLELLHAGYDVVVLDNLSNSTAAPLAEIAALSGSEPEFVEADVRDPSALDRVFGEPRRPIDAVIHFAALKAVGESCEQPLRYYENNVAGTLALLDAMERFGCRRLVFSSSATVYGDPATVPITEDYPLSATNPYGRTKLMMEDMMRDLAVAEPAWRILLLRYFNPIGAHPSGRIGEDPRGIPNNLMPYVMQVAAGLRPHLRVFGDDYPTPDGTGVRDYLHVVDLALGHVAALRALDGLEGATPLNLGTGKGYSVLEVVRAAEQAAKRAIPYEIVPRRPGDIATCYADPSRAERVLGWKATRGLDEMARDHWAWEAGRASDGA